MRTAPIPDPVAGTVPLELLFGVTDQVNLGDGPPRVSTDVDDIAAAAAAGAYDPVELASAQPDLSSEAADDYYAGAEYYVAEDGVVWAVYTYDPDAGVLGVARTGADEDESAMSVEIPLMGGVNPATSETDATMLLGADGSTATHTVKRVGTVVDGTLVVDGYASLQTITDATGAQSTTTQLGDFTMWHPTVETWITGPSMVEGRPTTGHARVEYSSDGAYAQDIAYELDAVGRDDDGTVVTRSVAASYDGAMVDGELDYAGYVSRSQDDDWGVAGTTELVDSTTGEWGIAPTLEAYVDVPPGTQAIEEDEDGDDGGFLDSVTGALETGAGAVGSVVDTVTEPLPDAVGEIAVPALVQAAMPAYVAADALLYDNVEGSGGVAMLVPLALLGGIVVAGEMGAWWVGAATVGNTSLYNEGDNWAGNPTERLNDWYDGVIPTFYEDDDDE